jgi:hypothetical protein
LQHYGNTQLNPLGVILNDEGTKQDIRKRKGQQVQQACCLYP